MKQEKWLWLWRQRCCTDRMSTAETPWSEINLDLMMSFDNEHSELLSNFPQIRFHLFPFFHTSDAGHRIWFKRRPENIRSSGVFFSFSSSAHRKKLFVTFVHGRLQKILRLEGLSRIILDRYEAEFLEICKASCLSCILQRCTRSIKPFS